MLIKIMLLGILAMNTYWDWKKKEIFLIPLIIAGGVGLLVQFAVHRESGWNILAGMGMGLVVALIAWLSREKIGIGDGLMLAVTGVYLGFWNNLEIFFLAILLCGMAAVFCLLIQRKDRHTQMAFIPFLLVAYMIWLIGV